jgi:hypothetical protein
VILLSTESKVWQQSLGDRAVLELPIGMDTERTVQQFEEYLKADLPPSFYGKDINWLIWQIRILLPTLTRQVQQQQDPQHLNCSLFPIASRQRWLR